MSAIDKSQPILIYLAGGVQGGAVVRAALRRGFKVRALVRDRKRVPALPAIGVELVEGDLRDPASLRAAGADMVFPEAITELEMYKLFAAASGFSKRTLGIA